MTLQTGLNAIKTSSVTPVLSNSAITKFVSHREWNELPVSESMPLVGNHKFGTSTTVVKEAKLGRDEVHRGDACNGWLHVTSIQTNIKHMVDPQANFVIYRFSFLRFEGMNIVNPIHRVYFLILFKFC